MKRIVHCAKMANCSMRTNACRAVRLVTTPTVMGRYVWTVLRDVTIARVILTVILVFRSIITIRLWDFVLLVIVFVWIVLDLGRKIVLLASLHWLCMVELVQLWSVLLVLMLILNWVVFHVHLNFQELLYATTPSLQNALERINTTVRIVCTATVW